MVRKEPREPRGTGAYTSMNEEYNHEKEQYKLRMEKWGMHTKDGYEVTINDCMQDLTALIKIHGESIKGVLIIPVYDHLDLQELDKKFPEDDDMDRPPTHSYLCSGGVPIMEAVGALEMAKMKIFQL